MESKDLYTKLFDYYTMCKTDETASSPQTSRLGAPAVPADEGIERMKLSLCFRLTNGNRLRRSMQTLI